MSDFGMVFCVVCRSFRSLNIQSENLVVVPECINPLTLEDQELLKQLVDPVSNSDNYGIELYERTEGRHGVGE